MRIGISSERNGLLWGTAVVQCGDVSETERDCSDREPQISRPLVPQSEAYESLRRGLRWIQE